MPPMPMPHPVPLAGPLGSTNPISPTQFLPGGTLPPSTHLEGRLLFLHETPADALTFTLRCPLAAPDAVQAAYVANPQNDASRVKIVVRPSALFVRARKSALERTSSHSTATADKAADDPESSDRVEVYLKEERERIKRLLNRNVRVTVGGMTVITMELGAKTATVQGSGPVWLQEGAKAPICLLDDRVTSDVSSLGNTPSWYHTPTNSSQITTSPAQPSLIAPPQRVSAQARNPASASAPAPAAGSLHPPAALKLTSDDIVSSGPSRLQPVSAFALSNPPALPSRRYAMPKPVPAPVPAPAPAAIPLPSHAAHAARTGKRPSPPANTVAGPVEKRARVDEQGKTGTTGTTGTTVQLGPSATGWTDRPPSPPAGRDLLPGSDSSGDAGASQRSAGIGSSDPEYGIPAIDGSADRANPSRELDARLLPDATEKRDPDPASRRSEAETRARQEAQERAEAETVQRSREAADAERLKRGFTSGSRFYSCLAGMRPAQGVNLCGVVLEVSPVKKTRTGDSIVNLVLTDPSNYKGTGDAEDFVLTVFRSKDADLPLNVVPGTPILVRDVKVTIFKDKPKGQIFTREGTWATLQGGKDLVIGDPARMHPNPGPAEVQRLAALWKWWCAEQGVSHVNGASATGARPAAGAANQRGSWDSDVQAGKAGKVTLGDVRHGMFFEAVFKILHLNINAQNRTPALELYVTDGTVSPHALRNFHNVEPRDLPRSAVYTIHVMDRPPDAELPSYQEGNFLHLRNLVGKMYQGELEIKWSNKITPDQLERNWRERKLHVLPKEDPRAKEIETRIRALKNGEQPPLAQPETPADGPVDVHSAPPDPAGQLVQAPSVPLATHLSTIFTDPIAHPLTPLANVLKNHTVPNRFRVRARVLSIHPRGVPGDSLVQRHCALNKQAFSGPFCGSCNDTTLKHASYRYRFVVVLESLDMTTAADRENDTTPAGATLPVIIADEEAESFLPPLPPMDGSTNPNDIKKKDAQIRRCCEDTEAILMGGRFDGERTRPVIEWGIESLVVKEPKRGKGEGKGVVAFRVCGMRGA